MVLSLILPAINEQLAAMEEQLVAINALLDRILAKREAAVAAPYPPLSPLPSPPSSPFSWSMPINQLSASPRQPPALDPGDDRKFSDTNSDNLVGKPDANPPHALDPGDDREISDPNPDNLVDEPDADPPPALDSGDHQTISNPNLDDPEDKLAQVQPPALDYGLVLTDSEKLASFGSAFKLFASSYPFHTNKKLLLMFADESQSVHWMARNAKEKGYNTWFKGYLPSRTIGMPCSLQKLWVPRTREYLQELQRTYPDFHLEDKVNFEEGGNDAGLISYN